MLDKRWIKDDDRTSLLYINGVDAFLDYAFGQVGVDDRIRCPCKGCRNTAYKSRAEIRIHLFKYGFFQSYTTWVFHGEKLGETKESSNSDFGAQMDEEVNTDHVDDVIGLIHDSYAFENMSASHTQEENDSEGPNDEAKRFYKLLKEATIELYPNCKVSKLHFIVKALHFKTLHKMSDTAMDAWLQIQKEILPDGALVPDSYYEARKIIRDLCLDYTKIDACKNDCILYWEEHEKAQSCPTCGHSRWKVNQGKRKIPYKVLRHFPLKPRLQKLFMEKSTAKAMRWHKEKRVEDIGVLRHPADSESWKSFDDEHKEFSADPRSVRLGLASDGFQPYGNMSSSHSIWPVVLIPYNLPPWMCMKHPYFMMTLLIPGPKCPENDIDVYLQPLIKELMELWEVGLETYDAYGKQNFQLHAAVLWTINDFPAYGNLSGWSTKGKLACPNCHKDTCSLSIRSKLCYMGHRRFLPIEDPWRDDETSFNGKTEYGLAPQMLTGDGVLDQLNHFAGVTFGKGQKRKRNDSNIVYNWKKKSIFFQLPYWKSLKLRHNLDVMHIERNVSDNVLGTVLNMKGKTKDTVKSRYDLVDLGIRESLHPYTNGNKIFLPAACYALAPREKTMFCNFLANIKVPDGFSSNISRCVNVNEKKVHGLKCHDHHVLLQRIFPLAIRGLLPKKVCEPLIELCNFFKNLCSKSLRVDALDKLEEKITRTLCKMETIFPPAFFDVMIHLPIHLAREAKIGGPVHYRWMYPIERYLRTLKSYVRNKSRPEGSISEGYIVDECLTFCSRYLRSVETKFNRAPRNDDRHAIHDGLPIFQRIGCAKGASKAYQLTMEEFDQARIYVLQNTEVVLPFLEEHRSEILRRSSRNVIERHNKEFPTWFSRHVSKLHEKGLASDDLLSLAIGPMRLVNRYSTYIVNGFRFHVKDRATERTSQNSGVLVRGDDSSTEKEYYGVLENVFELSYVGNNKVFLFKCHWWDVGRLGRGYKIDAYGYTSVNVNGCLSSNEPFVLASQAEQVFYVADIMNSDWLVVVKTSPRDLYSMPPDNETNIDDSDASSADEGDAYQEEEFDNDDYPTNIMENDNIGVTLTRTDIEAEGFSVNMGATMTNNEFADFIDDYNIDNDIHNGFSDSENTENVEFNDEFTSDD